MIKIIISAAILTILNSCTGFNQYKIPNKILHQSKMENSLLIENKLQSITDSLINQQELIGLQVSIKFPDGKIWNGCGGTIDEDRKIPISNDHIIRMGSLTKTYTAVLIFKLAEKGLLSLDDKLNKWFPSYNYSSKVSIRMLLNHSSGIPDLLGMKVMFLSTLNSGKKWTKDELLNLIFDNELDFAAGSDHQYSNSNYVLLGIIAEIVTGKSLNELYATEIFKPISLSNTYFLPLEIIPSKLITGYDRNLIPLPGWHTTEPNNTAWASCAFSSGSMAATASDILLFFNAVQNKTLVSDSSYQLMTHFAKAKEPKDKYFENFGMGLFQFGDYFGKTIGHLGLFVGSEAIALFSEEKNFIIVILTNTSRILNNDEIVQIYLKAISNLI